MIDMEAALPARIARKADCTNASLVLQHLVVLFGCESVMTLQVAASLRFSRTCEISFPVLTTELYSAHLTGGL